ncbi:transcriptional regulator [Ralstonia mannitolilytica]|uniref:heavy metal response regulator transcription factor n=1 Tax=Ralstonia mannitolilytica TaxID=105219 RepID=UPI0005D75071|nr:heavy metal response regulator transcription factor [Ralstonia mannitolilytica]AJW47409.1 transcriptional regulator [Ralstonia mannitolilytica]
MKLLVVEDELRAAEYLVKGLSESGYSVDGVDDGLDGIHAFKEGVYDAVILDVTLPGADGWSVIRTIKALSDTPVLILSARDDIAERVKAFELGADDYLGKPYAFAELLARLRRCLRQTSTRDSERMQVGDLDIDLLRRRVYRNGQWIELTNQEFMLLHLLVSRQGEVLSRAMIASQVWDVNFETNTNVVDVAIRRLRAKVDDPFDVRLIHTIRGMGYVLDPHRG